MSFFIVRLLQNFEDITLDLDSHPPDSRVPKEWAGAPGRKGIEKFWPKAHLTLYSKVSFRAVGLMHGVLIEYSTQGGLWIKTKEAQNIDTA